VNVCAPWRSACISWAALSSALPSSTVRYITYLLLLVSPPLVSAPATNRVRTLRQDISSLETPIAAVRQAYDGRPVRPRCRLLRFLLGGVGLGLHLYSLPLGCGCLIKARLPPSLVFCIIYYNYTTRRSTKQNRCLPRVLFLRALHHCVTDEQTSARQRRTPPRRHRA
jgi:hypothetical protein